MRKPALRLLVAVVWIAGNLAPLYLIWLLWPRAASPARPPVGDPASALALDFLLALVFPLQHSVWTQPPVKRWIQSVAGERMERPLYSLASGVALVATCHFWRTTGDPLWTAPEWTVWLMRGGIVAALVVQMICSTLLGPKFLLGLTHLKALAEDRPLPTQRFRLVGPYRFVRHPIAASQVFMVWMTGTLFADRLLLASLWTLWIVCVTLLEDGRLGREFGDTYTEYRRRAGFMWPRLGGGA